VRSIHHNLNCDAHTHNNIATQPDPLDWRAVLTQKGLVEKRILARRANCHLNWNPDRNSGRVFQVVKENHKSAYPIFVWELKREFDPVEHPGAEHDEQ